MYRKKAKKISNLKALITMLFISLSATGASENNPNLMTTPPKPSEWRAFLKFSKNQHQQLWQSLSAQGQKMSHWTWQWRMAWVRSCLERPASPKRGYCWNVLNQASHDKAAVVRGEAAKTIGLAKALNAGSLDILKSIYNHPKNFRHGKPLFVPYHVLDALARHNTKAAKTVGQSLSSQHPHTKSYWQELMAKP